MFRKTIITGVLLASFTTHTAFSSDVYNFTTTGVVDGDTLHIVIQSLPTELQKISVRIKHIDTPEKNHLAKCPTEKILGYKATEYLEKWYKRTKVVSYSNLSWDKYGGRVDADVYFDDVNVADTMIKEGLAKRYEGKKKESWCK